MTMREGPICSFQSHQDVETRRATERWEGRTRARSRAFAIISLRTSGSAAQTRVVSVAGIRLGSGESARAFKGLICGDISKFESYMPSHAALWALAGL
jgi:hypothetical protein